MSWLAVSAYKEYVSSPFENKYSEVQKEWHKLWSLKVNKIAYFRLRNWTKIGIRPLCGCPDPKSRAQQLRRGCAIFEKIDFFTVDIFENFLVLKYSIGKELSKAL